MRLSDEARELHNPSTAMAEAKGDATGVGGAEVGDQMARRGRPDTLDERARRMIVALVGGGNSLRVAGRYAGCASTTIRRTAARDPQFAEELQRAEMLSQVDSLRLVRQASQTQWRAAAWLLERRNPEDFGNGAAKPLTLSWMEDVVTDLLVELIDASDELIDRAVAYLRQAAMELAGEDAEADGAAQLASAKTGTKRDPFLQLPTTEELLEQMICGLNAPRRKRGAKPR